MRWLIRALVAVALLAALALGVAAWWLPRLVEGPAFRERLRAAAADATGRDVSWEELSVGVLPPRVTVTGVAVRDAERAVASAERVDLRVSPLPLLARAIVVDALVLEGVALQLVRTESGIELPVETGGGDASGDGEGAFAIAVRELALRRSRLVLEDRTVSPAVTWDLGELEASARASALDAPVELAASTALASGGRLDVAGTFRLDGTIDLVIRLEDVALAPVAPYLGGGLRLAGRVSGSLGARGPASAPEALDAKLDLADADVRLDEVWLRGRIALDATLSGALSAPSGAFEVDATNADLAYGQAFRKPPGASATATGRFVPGADGRVDVDDVRVHIVNVDGRAAAQP